MTQLRERVERGAHALDERFPGWDRNIRREHLDIASSRMCVLGQLFGSYDNGCAALWGSGAFVGPAAAYGFTSSAGILAGGDRQSEWQELNDEWLRFLQERERERALLPV